MGDAREVLRSLPDQSVQCVVTSPPYWGLRDYGVDGQIGQEETPEEYTAVLTALFHEASRVLRDDGTLWLNLGDTYGTGTTAGRPEKGSRGFGQGVMAEQNAVPRAGGQAKQMIGIPWRVAFALQADGWYLRSDIIWSKPNPMPESVTDRPTKAHEYLFLLSKSERYYYDHEAIMEASVRVGDWNNAVPAAQDYRMHTRHQVGERRNKRSVWEIATQPYAGAHFATFPEALVEPCILAGCPEGGTVLDMFAGSGTTLAVAKRLARKSIGIDASAPYLKLAVGRISAVTLPMSFTTAH